MIKNIQFRAENLALNPAMITIFNPKIIVGLRALCQCFLCSFFKYGEWEQRMYEKYNLIF